MLPAMEEGSGNERSGPTAAGSGTDHKEIAKHTMKKVASEMAVRKRMMEDTSNVMGFDWV